MKTIQVLIVDDHDVLRLGLRSALDDVDDVVIAGEAATADEALRRAAAIQPDVVLMDVRLTGDDDDTSGITACRALRSELPDVGVLMFSSFSDRDTVEAAIMAGATGYLTKNVSRSRLIEAIRATARGESLLNPSVTGAVLDRLRHLSEGRPPEPALSAREREVLALVAEGLTNREIAERLVLSEHTARNHVANILNKLGLSRRVQAATYAARLGIDSELGGL